MKPMLVRLFAAAMMALLLSACASSSSNIGAAGTSRAVASADALGAPDSTTASGEYTGDSEYRIGAQDLLEISVFQVPDLNRAVRVNSNGLVSLPLIGQMTAGGKTVQELEAEIASKLEQGYLQSPQVTVFVKEFTSQRVTVEGAVRKPGIYPLTGRTSLLQTIALAEGVTDLANLDGIVVFRTIDGKKMAAVFSLKQIRSGEAPDPQVYGDDIVVVDTSGGKSALRQIMQVVPFFNLFAVY
jgi:polysaccharide export outer membrane protein